ncbi:transposase [Agrobacterium tumefaciens]|nr:transposase [Agrobacterium tumefaciens]
MHEWTRFADHVTHVRTGDVPKNVSAMLAGVLVDATNLGPKRMAGASKGRSAQQIGWMRTFHARSGHTTRLKLASPLRTPGIRIRAFWGNDTTSSSSPFFRASDRAAKRGDISCITVASADRNSIAICQIQYGYFSILPNTGGLSRRGHRTPACPYRRDFATLGLLRSKKISCQYSLYVRRPPS